MSMIEQLFWIVFGLSLSVILASIALFSIALLYIFIREEVFK